MTTSRLTANTNADASFFLQAAVEKLPFSVPKNDAQTLSVGGHLPSLAGTVNDGIKSENEPKEMRLKSLSFTVYHEESENG